MPPLDIDVLVIGSGFGAAPPALRMAEAGWSVRVLEKGPPVGRETFRLTQDPQYLMQYLKGLSGDRLNLTYAEALGGGSGFYEMVSLRAPTAAFEQPDARGTPLWPSGMDRASMDPWYEIAEQMLGVEQIGSHEVPRSGLVFARLMRNLGYSCDRARYAVRDCLGSGFCVSGCAFGRKQSLHLNYIPQAEAAGAEFVTDTEAISLRPLGGTGWRGTHRPGERPPLRYEVIARHRATGARTVHRARVVVLGGGTVGTAALLLAARGAMPRLSPLVGRNIAFNGGARVAALLPEGFPSGDMFAGRSHPGMISYEFLPSHGLTISAVKPLPLQLIATARLALPDGGARPEWWGADHVTLMRLYRERVIALISLGLTPPDGHLTLDERGRPRIGLVPSRQLQLHKHRAGRLLADILVRNGCRMIETTFINQSGQPLPTDHVSTAHHVGAARMADGPDRGVCDVNGEVFHYPGLYVADGAAIPSSLAVNTSLTILANAERIAAGLVLRHAGSAPAPYASSAR